MSKSIFSSGFIRVFVSAWVAALAFIPALFPAKTHVSAAEIILSEKENGVAYAGAAEDNYVYEEHEEADEARLPVIMYHSVSRGAVGRYVVSPETLAHDLDELAARGYETVLPREVAKFAFGRYRLPKKPIMLTFDDGHYNFLSEVLPLLVAHGMKATVAVVGLYARREQGKKSRSGYFSYLSPDEIAGLAVVSRVEIANHSDSLHSGTGALPAPGESYEHYKHRFVWDLNRCDELIRSAGASPHVFVCPFGRYARYTLSAAAEFGYDTVMTCEEKVNLVRRGGENTPIVLGRFNRPSGPSSAQFLDRIERKI